MAAVVFFSALGIFTSQVGLFLQRRDRESVICPSVLQHVRSCSGWDPSWRPAEAKDWAPG